MQARFDPAVVAAAEHDLVIGVRVGDDHRFIGVWSVVVDGRIFARSWSLKPDGWNAAISDSAPVTVQIGGREYAAQAVRVTSEHRGDEVDEAYRATYHTPASLKYVADLNAPASKASTVEFVPR